MLTGRASIGSVMIGTIALVCRARVMFCSAYSKSSPIWPDDACAVTAAPAKKYSAFFSSSALSAAAAAGAAGLPAVRRLNVPPAPAADSIG